MTHIAVLFIERDGILKEPPPLNLILTERQQEACLLYGREGATAAAKQMGIGLRTFYDHIRRAKANIKKAGGDPNVIRPGSM